jgi:hypothetical protein
VYAKKAREVYLDGPVLVSSAPAVRRLRATPANWWIFPLPAQLHIPGRGKNIRQYKKKFFGTVTSPSCDPLFSCFLVVLHALKKTQQTQSKSPKKRFSPTLPTFSSHFRFNCPNLQVVSMCGYPRPD